MTQRIIYIFLSLFLNFFLFQMVFADDFCESLKLTLNEIIKRKAEAEEALKQNDRDLMQAQEILLLARAKGDKKAGQVAEDAIKRFEDSIAKNKKIIRGYDEEISRIEKMLKLCSGDECKTIESKIERTREALKRTVKDAERQSKEYEELQQRLEDLRELTEELSRVDNLLDFIINIIGGTGALEDAFESVRIVKKLKEKLKKPIALISSGFQFSKDNAELVRALEAEAERTARALFEARSYAEEVKEKVKKDPNLARAFIDAGLDLNELIMKIINYKGLLEKIIKLNKLFKASEYACKTIYRRIYINVGYELLGEELSTRLYATDKTMEAIEALKKELHREMEIYKACKEMGRLNQ